MRQWVGKPIAARKQRDLRRGRGAGGGRGVFRTSPQQATCLEETTLPWRQLSSSAVRLKYDTRHIDGIF